MPVYLDHNATTPVADEVGDAMANALRECFGNPSSVYAPGRDAARRLAAARLAVARLIGAHVDEIVFTGCATEANNLALLGMAAACSPARRHLVTSAVEYLAVLELARHLEARGWQLTVVPGNATGRVSPDDVAAVAETVMASVDSACHTGQTAPSRCAGSHGPRQPAGRSGRATVDRLGCHPRRYLPRRR